jgi:UDPglucose 6-dehydrogenase
VAFTDSMTQAIREAVVVFICVGTPARGDGEANLLAMERSATAIAHHARDGVVVVEKSTVPAGTADRLRLALAREGDSLRFDVACNPEFLREGSALRDALEPDRIVIGVESERAAVVLRRLYEPLTRNGVPLIETDIKTAELAKAASNAFLALKISYANALARICERLGADIRAVTDVMGADARIGGSFLAAGLGYGGYCFPKDVVILERLAARVGYDFPLLREVDRLNHESVEATAAKIEEALWNLDEKRIAIFGLAFKPGTDDVRLSPALALARLLHRSGASIVGCDPLAAANAKDELPELEIAPDPYAAAANAHCVVIATDWDEFRSLDLAALRDVMAYPLVVDGRNIFDPEEMLAAGFSYYPTGQRPLLTDPSDTREVDVHRGRIGAPPGSGWPG